MSCILKSNQDEPKNGGITRIFLHNEKTGEFILVKDFEEEERLENIKQNRDQKLNKLLGDV